LPKDDITIQFRDLICEPTADRCARVARSDGRGDLSAIEQPGVDAAKADRRIVNIAAEIDEAIACDGRFHNSLFAAHVRAWPRLVQKVEEDLAAGLAVRFPNHAPLPI
jgi:hypothetical protein